MTPQSEDEDTETPPAPVRGPVLTPVRPGVKTTQLAREAATSAGLTTKRPAEERSTREPQAKRPDTAPSQGRRESVQLVGERRREEPAVANYRIPFKNSTKFPKDVRPSHLQDDELFDLLSLGEVTSQIAMWAQTKAVLESNTLKVKKAEKGIFKTNTTIKKINVEAGEDDATTIFHPQRYQLRPPVVSMTKVWANYPTHWPEVYYSIDLSDVGLDNVLGQKQKELLHDRRSQIQIKMFAPSNANVGRSGFKTTNLKTGEDGTTDVVTRDEWAKLVTLNELLMSLDNLVAAWGCLWEGDRCMLILRRIVTKNKEFASIQNAEKRFRVLELFINKVLEINARKATQGEICLNFKDGDALAKEYLENANEYVTLSGGVSEQQQQQKQPQQQGGGGSNKNNWSNTKEAPSEMMERLLKGQKMGSREFCIQYNLKGDKPGESRCRDRKCAKAHNCAFFTRGEKRPCSGRHGKWEHHKLMGF